MKFIFLLIIVVLNSHQILNAQNTNSMKEDVKNPCLFIHKIAINVKSKREDRNPPGIYRYALIRGCAENENEQRMAVQVLTLQFEQQSIGFGIYQILKVFNTTVEARTYAFMNHIRITSEREGYEKVLGYVPDFRENVLSPQNISTDKIIQAIEQNLPSDWELLQTGEDKKEFPNKFTLRAKYQAWETQENLINANFQVLKKIYAPEYYTKKGKKITPFIRFSLNQPWQKIELDNVEYSENNKQYYYANSQYFGLKVIGFSGIPGDFNQIHVPENIGVSPLQMYEKIYQLLKPQEIIGIAQRAKLSDIIRTENGELYYIDEGYSLWQKWTDAEIGKKVKVKATLLTQNSDLPTRNEKGEIQQGLEGKINLLIRPVRQLFEQEITLVGKLKIIDTTNDLGSNDFSMYYLLTDDGKIYYLEGIDNWILKEKFLNKRLTIKGIYTEIEQKRIPQCRKYQGKGFIKKRGRDTIVVFPVITQLQLPEIEKSSSLIVVFKKNDEADDRDELIIEGNYSDESPYFQIMEYTDYPFWEGMDGSKGKAYFLKTGEKYHIIFPSEEEKKNCIEYLKNKPEIYEIYTPDWNIQKD